MPKLRVLQQVVNVKNCISVTKKTFCCNILYKPNQFFGKTGTRLT